MEINIFTFIENLILNFIGTIVQFFPIADATLLSQLTTNWSSFRTALHNVSFFFPVNVFFVLMAFVVVLELAMLTYKFIRTIVNLNPIMKIDS